MAKTTDIKGKILKVLRDSRQPQTADQVIRRLADGDGDTKVQDAIVSLVDQGKLVVTLDWKLRLKEAS
jgi:hypothetical protein